MHSFQIHLVNHISFMFLLLGCRSFIFFHFSFNNELKKWSVSCEIWVWWFFNDIAKRSLESVADYSLDSILKPWFLLANLLTLCRRLDSLLHCSHWGIGHHRFQYLFSCSGRRRLTASLPLKLVGHKFWSLTTIRSNAGPATPSVNLLLFRIVLKSLVWCSNHYTVSLKLCCRSVYFPFSCQYWRQYKFS